MKLTEDITICNGEDDLKEVMKSMIGKFFVTKHDEKYSVIRVD